MATTGWIGRHPLTGADQAHLLLYPLRHGVAQQMRTLAGLLGLARADTATMGEVAPDTTHLMLHGHEVTVHYGQEAALTRPVTTEWAGVAGGTHTVVLSIGTDGWTGQHLEQYLARSVRLHTGLVRVVDTTKNP